MDTEQGSNQDTGSPQGAGEALPTPAPAAEDTGETASWLTSENVASVSGGPLEPSDVLADNDLVGVLTSVSPEVASTLDHTLDHLTTATDLFDVPAIDFPDV